MHWELSSPSSRMSPNRVFFLEVKKYFEKLSWFLFSAMGYEPRLLFVRFNPSHTFLFVPFLELEISTSIIHQWLNNALGNSVYGFEIRFLTDLTGALLILSRDSYLMFLSDQGAEPLSLASIFSSFFRKRDFFFLSRISSSRSKSPFYLLYISTTVTDSDKSIRLTVEEEKEKKSWHVFLGSP